LAELASARSRCRLCFEPETRDARLEVQHMADAGFLVVSAEKREANVLLTTPSPDAALFAAIAEWRSLWSASEALPDFDPRGAELRRQAYDLEWKIADMEPSTVAGYTAMRDAIRQFDFDHEDSIEIMWSLAWTAGRFGIDRQMPDIRSPR
jgi:hypothetical protein